MRIIVCHNFYQLPGGEDRVFADEVALLTGAGHDVVTFTKHNDAVGEMSAASLAVRTIWNRESARELEQLVRSHRADVVHFHNTLPLISPACYYAARRAGAAVVQTLHNYRLICPKATFFRDGAPCESCAGKLVPWPAIQHACYRDNRAATAAIAALLTIHRALRTYRRAVDAYIALSEFLRNRLVAAGLPEHKVHLRPNFMIEDPGPGWGDGGYAIYVGRLSPEKGIDTLLAAWQRHDPGVPLLICGDGPLAPVVKAAVNSSPNITWLPNVPHAEILDRIGRASMLVLPSLTYEGFPKTIAEAYSKGTPVVASRHGALAELVREGESGACCTLGDAAEFAATVRRMHGDARGLARMRTVARSLFEAHYAAGPSLARLMEIYDQALRVRHSRAADRAVTADAAKASSDTFSALETATTGDTVIEPRRPSRREGAPQPAERTSGYCAEIDSEPELPASYLPHPASAESSHQQVTHL
jgi:glycosyltransferase involved in cell wall biosynthesis